MKFRYLYLLGILISLISISGCRKFVVVPPPNTELVTTNVFNDGGAATAAMTSIYTQIYSNYESLNMSLYCGLLSDELQNYSNSPVNKQYYTNSMASINGLGCWANAYNYIFQCNAVIENIKQSISLTPEIKNQLTGEAKFLRSFWFFYLTNCYGSVPLVTTTDYTINQSLARSSQSTVLNQVISDLKDAKNLMNSNFIDGSDTAITTERTRPNRWAASALLARVYLYTQKYDSAEAEASTVIGNTALFNILTDLNSVFLANSQEAIWQIQVPLPNYIGINTPDGYGFILLANPTGGAQTISPQLFNSFERGDLRFSNWVGSFIDTTTSPADTFYFPYKYKVSSAVDVTEYIMVLRLAEQILIRAEARANQNNLGGAVSDINILRMRAGLPAINPTTLSDVQSAILHERQVELFTEWGHRWFDLIRTNNANSVMGAVTPKKGGTWSPNWQLFPIPLSDLKLDPFLTQNIGYN